MQAGGGDLDHDGAGLRLRILEGAVARGGSVLVQDGGVHRPESATRAVLGPIAPGGCDPGAPTVAHHEQRAAPPGRHQPRRARGRRRRGRGRLLLEPVRRARVSGPTAAPSSTSAISSSRCSRPAPARTATSGSSSTTRSAPARCCSRTGVELLPGGRLDFRDPFGNRVQIVQYDQIQFLKDRPACCARSGGRAWARPTRRSRSCGRTPWRTRVRPMEDRVLQIVGGGRMGEALLGGLIAAGRAPESLAVVEVFAERREAARERVPGRDRGGRAGVRPGRADRRQARRRARRRGRRRRGRRRAGAVRHGGRDDERARGVRPAALHPRDAQHARR